MIQIIKEKYSKMSIEDNIFKKHKVIKEKLEPYGFIKEIDKYKFSKKFMENKFQAVIYIGSNNKISGKSSNI